MFFSKIFGKKESIDFIIAGLGNPGINYAVTRHNAGFMFIDTLAEKYSIEINRKMCSALCGSAVIGGKNCLVVKPQTFMNSSGIAISKLMKKYNLSPEKILIISDDVSFDIGKTRIRRSGSSGGQNGLNSIIDEIGSENFPRIKIGVGKKPSDCKMVDWVLGNFGFDELENIKSVLERTIDAVPMIVNGDIENAMQKFN